MCDVTLEAGTNWYISMMKKHHYRCIPCDNKVTAISNRKRMYVNGKHIPKKHPYINQEGTKHLMTQPLLVLIS